MAVRAVNDGAQIILGPVFAQEANAAGVAVAPRGVNVLSFSNNTDIAGGNVFVLGPTFQNTANRLAAYAVRQGKRRIMVVHDQNTAGEVGRAAIEARASPMRAASVVATVGLRILAERHRRRRCRASRPRRVVHNAMRCS
jgi:ABC-type branched-subunit amino acid transport system substrate-binding protein